MPRAIERTVYKFAELSEAAKETAREHERQTYQDFNWWDWCYEDAIICAKCLGIELDAKNISFSGFSSQGDGASFTGYYDFKADAVAAITAHAPQDQTLLKIAEEQTALQTHARLVHGAHIHARITRSRNSHYVHSNTMDIEAKYVNTDNEALATSEELDQAMTRLMRSFADWIYKQLEDENDWLNSDECIDERLNESDDEFDEDGSVV